VLQGESQQRVRELFADIAEQYDITIEEMEVCLDHVHIFGSFPPRYSIAQVVTRFKSLRARAIFRECPRIKRRLWGGELGEDGYCARTVGDKVTAEVIRRCNPDCRWHSTPTIKSLFGSTIHPDLATLHCAQGAWYSYREAEKNLETWNGHPRRVNNHMHVKRMTDKVGAVLSEHNRLAPAAAECPAPAKDLIIQVDGGHIPIQEKDKRSFEALAAIVYRPEHLQAVDHHHRQIMEKTCVISAMDDNLRTMKAYLLKAAHKQGMSQETKVTALADGAKNCWSVLSALTPECETLECILDWFHIAQKFQNVKNALGEAFTTSLESAKWKLWHGYPQDALTKLALLRDNSTDEGHRSKLIERDRFELS
jgi:REP element-mobilizing transposase RayT